MSKTIRNIEYIKSQNPLKNQTYDILIPAAGMSTRMKMAGAKPLIYIGNKKLIDHQIDIVDKVFNKKNIIVVSGFESNKVMDYLGIRTINVENERYQTTGVSRSISLGLRASKANSIIIIYGDLFFDKEAINNAYRNKSFIITSDTMTDNEVGCIINNKGCVESLFYEHKTKWGQIAYFTGLEYDLLKKIVYNKGNEKMYGYEILNKIIDMGGVFLAVQPKSYIQDIDTSKDLALVEKYWNENNSKF